MMFKIYSTETNKNISVNEFESLYNQFIGREHSYKYGLWYEVLKGLYDTYEDITDNCKNSRLYKSLHIEYGKEIMTLRQAAQVLIIYYGQTFRENDKFEYINYIKDAVNFFQHYQDKYYFKFYF